MDNCISIGRETNGPYSDCLVRARLMRQPLMVRPLWTTYTVLEHYRGTLSGNAWLHGAQLDIGSHDSFKTVGYHLTQKTLTGSLDNMRFHCLISRLPRRWVDHYVYFWQAFQPAFFWRWCTKEHCCLAIHRWQQWRRLAPLAESFCKPRDDHVRSQCGVWFLCMDWGTEQ